MVKQLESVAAKQLKLLAHSDRKIEKLEKQISHYKCEVKYNGHVIDSSWLILVMRWNVAKCNS